MKIRQKTYVTTVLYRIVLKITESEDLDKKGFGHRDWFVRDIVFVSLLFREL